MVQFIPQYFKQIFMDNNGFPPYSDDLKPYRPLFDNSLDAIYLINGSGTIVECNKAAIGLSSKYSSNVIGVNIHECLFRGRLNINITELFHKLAQGESMQPIVYKVEEENSNSWFELTHVFISHTLIAFRVSDLTNYMRIVEELENSEAYNKILFSDSNIPLVVMDAETHEFIDCNDSAVRIYGFSSKEELLRKKPIDVSTLIQYNGELSLKLAHERISEALEKGAIRFEWLHQRPNGEQWDGEIHLMSFKYKERQLLQFSLRDISDRKKTLQALVENEQKYKTLFESANDAIFLMDTQKFIDCNALTLQMFKCTRDQIINRSPVEFSPKYQPDGQLSSDKARVKIAGAVAGKPQFFEWLHSTIDGTLFDAEVSLNRVFINGSFFLIAIVRDISDRKKIERAIKASEEKFRIISMHSNDVIWIRNLDLSFRYISPSCKKVLGYSIEEAMTLKLEQIATPEYVEKISQILKEELGVESKSDADSSRTRILEIQERRKDGAMIWTQTQVSFIRDTEGVIDGFLGVTRDITSHKLYEEALRESEQRFRITAEKTGEIVFEYDIMTGKIVWLGAIEAITGYSFIDFENLGIDHWNQLIHPDDRMYAINELEKAIVTNCDYLVEYRFQKKDGTYIFIEERAIVLPGMQKMYGTMNNISERKKNQAILYENEKRLKEQNEEYLTLNEELVERNIRVAEMYDELLRAKEKAEENDRLKSAFLANISHEIRTPMNGLVGFSELIIQPDLDDESKKSYAEIINKSCNQLLSIINDVIDISKIETNQVTTNETNVLLNHLLSNIYQFFLPTAKSNNIQLVFANKDINDDIAILVDEVKLTQIMNNLVNNAIKFTSSGKIEFGYDINSEFLEFFVKDTGIGIEAKDYELIFDRFRQVDLGMARNYGGTGLGLSISKAFVEKMGGRIWLDSKVSEGTTFYFTIPYKPIINKEKKKLTINEKQLAIHDTNILVAEDEDINFMYVKVLLDSLGFKVVRAENGKRAVDIFTNNPKFDIILMDIKMPIMGGIEATKIIKSINASVPIIATTAYALSEEKDKFLAAGCDDYISKPLRPNDLMSVINKFINK